MAMLLTRHGRKYIVGLIVPVEQQVLNGAGGLINYIDYATGRFRVGGIPGNPTSGTLCEINDPVGRFGKPHSPDPRFTCDYQQPDDHYLHGLSGGHTQCGAPAE